MTSIRSAGSPQAQAGRTASSDYRPPTWPGTGTGQEKQAHIDVGADDLDVGEARLLALGATKPDFQPSPDRWRVLLDPAGHPFCVSTVA
ncbi:hypothetical protein STENM223S_01993 [Streptomyces tendae]